MISWNHSRFGFCINGCIDVFPRHIIWLNVYFTNGDPSVIAGYYFEAISSLKGCPVFMRGDPGTENIRVKDFQTLLMREERSGNAHAYIDCTSTANQRIESFWGQLRKQCVQFWLELLHGLQNAGEFTGTFLDKQLLLFCFLGMIQVNMFTSYVVQGVISCIWLISFSYVCYLIDQESHQNVMSCVRPFTLRT